MALRITGRHEDALDVVQDSFIKAFDSLAGFSGAESSFRTWFLRLVTNRALDLLRSRRVRRAEPIEADNGEERPRGLTLMDERGAAIDAGLERAELGEQLRRALESLPLEQRTAFALYATGELTYQDIADATGVPIGTVMSRLFHARKRLQAMLKDLE